MKVLILGGGFMQINAIRRSKAKGLTVIVADYLPDAPGKKLADFAEMVSTFDIEGNIEIARKYGIDGVFTIGTDQPVLTAAKVAEAFGLPRMISSETALWATNKKYMKEVFVNNDIPSSRYLMVKKEDLKDKTDLYKRLSALNFPIVVKPIDSQGQRGVFKIYSLEDDVVSFMNQTFAFTWADEIIVEEFCHGDEITVSAWVEDLIPYILMITDRPLLNVEPHLGIPDGHVFPSIYTFSHYEKIKEVVEKIVKAFNIFSGPIYIQMIVNGNNLEVVEVACRIGGGHEEELIPLVSGIDIVDIFIEKSIGRSVDICKIKNYDLLSNNKYAMVKFIVGKPGKVKEVRSLDQVKKMPGVVNAGFYKPDIKEIRPLVDSTCRLGYLLVEGRNRKDLERKVIEAYKKVEIIDGSGENMVCFM
ncbi:ATP-grasp domain-containing protein [Thermosyntropha sp.]|uniref:ATP-grasp domain-containing protein n=1 Tax=Thermosyntropha sp. TaxID=2740820 RepID=UPI0025D2B4EF|nr:ATP-grasp domain-containing protein [Thermosyntropha sp.]MBO8159215.1 ATP-grasp domain-containing protein [Thermosyntropha sp.]